MLLELNSDCNFTVIPKSNIYDYAFAKNRVLNFRTRFHHTELRELSVRNAFCLLFRHWKGTRAKYSVVPLNDSAYLHLTIAL